MTVQVQVITFGDGRLNPLGRSTRSRLYDDLKAAERDPRIKSVVLTGKGSNFSAGADITEFDSSVVADVTDTNTDTTVVSLRDVVTYVESFPKPVVAAIQGVALGGGLELALASHYRIAAPSATMGLPEVTIGVIPGAGGTQRLPRLIAVTKALDMILTGKPVTAKKALEIGLVDAVIVSDMTESLIQTATKWADWAQLMPLDDRRLLQQPLKETPAELKAIVKAAREKLRPPRNRGGESVHCALEAVEACGGNPNNGMKRESQLFYQALAQGHGQRHAFFAVRAAQKSQLTDATPLSHPLLQHPNDVVHVGVVGAGTMGSGIALVLLQTGFTVHLVDSQQEALQKGVAFLTKTLHSMALKGTLSESKASLLLSRLVPSSSLQDLKECALVVEAVVENLVIKKKIFTTLGQVTPLTCLLLSNTSTLDIDQMASVLSSPERQKLCAGWHFFSPAHVMKLVEIVVAKKTSHQTVALLQILTRKIGKIGVTVGNCDGFVGNRMLNPYTSECVLLLAEGDAATVESVDEAILDFGMALGPFGMSDLAGNDIGYFIRKERGLVKDPKTNCAPNRKLGMRYTELGDDLVTELGRIGQKVGKGWYDYDISVGKGRTPIPSPQVSQFIQRYYAVHKNSKGRACPILTRQEIVERVLFPLVNEGFKILSEGIAQKPSDIDVVYLYGYGWPVWRGGPMYWADHEIGLPRLLKRLQEFSLQFPGSDYYKPSPLLEECVHLNLTVEEYFKRGLHQTATSKL